jgi:hypothetical protein
MKKLFIVLAVASLGFVACNNESKTEEAAPDTTVVTPVDTTVVAPVDTTATADTTKK